MLTVGVRASLLCKKCTQTSSLYYIKFPFRDILIKYLEKANDRWKKSLSSIRRRLGLLKRGRPRRWNRVRTEHSLRSIFRIREMIDTTFSHVISALWKKNAIIITFHVENCVEFSAKCKNSWYKKHECFTLDHQSFKICD